jgi:hypothetical protein
LSSTKTVSKFLEAAVDHREKLERDRTCPKITKGWYNVGWVLFKAVELKKLKESLHLSMMNIELLFSTAQQ